MGCRNTLNNKLVEELVIKVVQNETEDLKFLQESMLELVKTLRTLVLGEYADEFLRSYLNNALLDYGVDLEDFAKIPSLISTLEEEIKKNRELRLNLFNFVDAEILQQNHYLKERLDVLENAILN